MSSVRTLGCVDMALLKYFQRVSDALPSPDGPLSVSVPSSSISATNKMVKRAIEPATTARKRGSYDSFTPEEKARIAKRASEHGVTALFATSPRYIHL